MTSTKRITLKVPLLGERPVIGSGCCVVLAEDTVRGKLVYPTLYSFRSVEGHRDE